jgi:hypothetical protein
VKPTISWNFHFTNRALFSSFKGLGAPARMVILPKKPYVRKIIFAFALEQDQFFRIFD